MILILLLDRVLSYIALAGRALLFFACPKKSNQKKGHPAIAYSGRLLISISKSRSDMPSGSGITKNRIPAVFPFTERKRARRSRRAPDTDCSPSVAQSCIPVIASTAWQSTMHIVDSLLGSTLPSIHHPEQREGSNIAKKIPNHIKNNAEPKIQGATEGEPYQTGAPCERQTRFPSVCGKNTWMHSLVKKSLDGESERLGLQEKATRLEIVNLRVCFLGSVLLHKQKNERRPGEGNLRRTESLQFKGALKK